MTLPPMNDPDQTPGYFMNPQSGRMEFYDGIMWHGTDAVNQNTGFQGRRGSSTPQGPVGVAVAIIGFIIFIIIAVTMFSNFNKQLPGVGPQYPQLPDGTVTQLP